MPTKSSKKASYSFKKTFYKAFLVFMFSLAYLGAEHSYYFQANLLQDITHKPFDGTISSPIKKVPDWGSLNEEEFNNMRNGLVTYNSYPENKLIDLPKYDLNILSKERTESTATTHNTFLTVYMGQYTSGYMPAKEYSGSHVGIDIRGLKGTPIHAIANGIVSKVNDDDTLGKYIVLKHNDIPQDDGSTKTYYSSYLHLDSINVVTGQVIEKDEVIGTLGSSGLSTTYHLHFQIDNEDAPYHPFWPFTWDDVKKANTNFYDAVDMGLGKDEGIKYTMNPLSFTSKYISYSPNDSDPVVVDKPKTIVQEKNEPVSDTVVEIKTENKQTQSVTSNEVMSLEITSDSNKFEPGKPIELSIRTLDINGETTIMPIFGDITIKDLNGEKSVSNSYIKNPSFRNGELSTTITLNQGLPYNLMIGSGVINGTIQLYPKSTQIFLDVPQNYFAKESIEHFAKQGLIKGYNDGTFKPENKISRAEIVKIALEASKTKLRTINVADLSNDIKLNDWHSQYVYTAKKEGIISGFEDGSIQPNKFVNKAEALKIALVATNKISKNTNEQNPWYQVYVDKINQLGINPFNNTGFISDKELTRAEAVNLIYQLVN